MRRYGLRACPSVFFWVQSWSAGYLRNPRTWSHAWTSDANARSSSVFRKPPAMAMSWRPKTASAFVTFGLARRVVNVLSTYPGATLTKMTLVPNSSLGIQNTSSLLTGSLHLRERTVRDPDRPHVVDSRPRIDQRWLITVWTRRMEKSPTLSFLKNL